MRLVVLGLIGSCLAIATALTPASYFTNVDQERLSNVFRAAQPYSDDLQSLYYSVLGVNLLGAAHDEAIKTCDILKKHTDNTNVDSIFYSSSAIKLLKQQKSIPECPVKYDGAEKVLNDAVNDKSTSKTIYYAVAALSNLGKKIDAGKVSKALDAAIAADESPLSHAYAFYAAALLTGDVSKYHALIEDMVAQADEIDDVIMRFEGGLIPTASVIDASYKLAVTAKKSPTIAEEQVVKFVNYMLSRKHVQSLENAAVLLQVVKTLTDNPYHVPIAVTLASQVSVSDDYPIVQVRVSNLLGKSLGKLSVSADTARHLGDDAVVLSKKPFTSSQSDSTLYELDFLKHKPPRGFYRFSLSVAPTQKDARLIATSGAEVQVKVTTKIKVENVEIGVADKEQASAAKPTKLTHPSKANVVLEADYHQKITITFTLIDRLSNKAMTSHQAFVKLTNLEMSAEIVFVSEADSADKYKFEMDVGANAKQFAHRSGKYSVELIVGDAVIQNPFSWNMADVKLTFPDVSKSSAAGDTPDRYAKMPEITHMFREPEPRPAAVVSNVFTALVLSPLLILVILWLRVGVNVSNFPASLSALGFHIGLGGIFALYYCYFVQLNMFATVKYLCLLGVPTFLFGNRLLSGVASKRKQ